MLALHLTGGERLPGMQNRFDLIPGKRREKRVHMIIHHDISGELIALTLEALHRRHHKVVLAVGNPWKRRPAIGDYHWVLEKEARAKTLAHLPIRRRLAPQGRLSAETPVPLIFG